MCNKKPIQSLCQNRFFSQRWQGWRQTSPHYIEVCSFLHPGYLPSTAAGSFCFFLPFCTAHQIEVMTCNELIPFVSAFFFPPSGSDEGLVRRSRGWWVFFVFWWSPSWPADMHVRLPESSDECDASSRNVDQKLKQTPAPTLNAGKKRSKCALSWIWHFSFTSIVTSNQRFSG